MRSRRGHQRELRRRRRRSAARPGCRSRRGDRAPRAGRPAPRSRRPPCTGARRRRTATRRVSSPLRNRWQRTPPVPRPLPGYSANGVTLTRPASVPGRASDEPDTVTTTLSAPASTAPKKTDPRTGREPDAGDAAAGAPCGRTPEAGKRSSWASEVTNTSSSSSLRELEPADDLVAVVEPDDVPGVAVAEHLGLDPLDDAALGCRAPARASPSASDVSVTARSPGSSDEELGDRCAALQLGRVRRRRQRRQVEHVELDQPAARGDDADRAACGRRRATAMTTSCLARAPPRPSGSSLRACARAARSTTAARSTGRRRPRAARPTSPGAPADSSSTVRRGVPCCLATSASSSPTTLRSSASSSRIAVSSSIVRSSSAFSRSSSSLRELGQPAQRHVEDVVGLDLGQVEDRHQPAAWPARRCRWTGSAG